MNTEQRITYSVAFKGVIELVSAGIVEFETTDIVAEVIELTDAFNAALAVRQGLEGAVEAAPLAASVSAVAPSSTQRFASSTPQASTPSGSTEAKVVNFKTPDAPATPPQVGYLKKLVGEKGVPSDANGFELAGVAHNFDEFTMQGIQVPIEALKAL